MRFIYGMIYSLFYFCFGGIGYYLIEILYRGYSHYSMFLCGGIIFYLISIINKRFEASVPILYRMLLSTCIIVFVELIFGIIFNLELQLHIWDYSDRMFNWNGQICLLFSVLWFFLSLPVLCLDQWIRKELLL